LEKVVDILIVISNQKLLSFDKNLTFIRSFEIVDEVLYQSIEVKTLSIKTLFLLEYVKMKLFKGILNLMARPGLINLDFADLKTVMESTGRAFIGTGSQTSSFFN
jgi:cell division protein FtsZ